MLYYGWLAGLLPFLWLFWLLSIGVFGALFVNICRLAGKALTDWEQPQNERDEQLRISSFLVVLVLIGLHAFGIWDPVNAVFNHWEMVLMVVASYIGIGFLYMNLNGLYEVVKERKRRRRQLRQEKENFFAKKKFEHTGTNPFNPVDYTEEWQEWKEETGLLNPPDVSKYRSHLIAWMIFWTPHLVYRMTVGWIQGIRNFFRSIIDLMRNFHQSVVNRVFKNIDKDI